MSHITNVKKKKHSALALAALLGGCLVSLNTFAVHNATYTNTYNIGTLSTSPYVNSATVTGVFSDRYNFSIVGSSVTAGSALTLNLDLGNIGFHISNLELDLYNAGGTWLDGDMVTGPNDVAVSLTETLVAGNYFFRVQGTGDGDTTGKGIYAFTAAAAPVPEADTYAMMLAGLGLIGFMVSRRRKS